MEIINYAFDVLPELEKAQGQEMALKFRKARV